MKTKSLDKTVRVLRKNFDNKETFKMRIYNGRSGKAFTYDARAWSLYQLLKNDFNEYWDKFRWFEY